MLRWKGPRARVINWQIIRSYRSWVSVRYRPKPLISGLIDNEENMESLQLCTHSNLRLLGWIEVSYKLSAPSKYHRHFCSRSIALIVTCLPGRNRAVTTCNRYATTSLCSSFSPGWFEETKFQVIASSLGLLWSVSNSTLPLLASCSIRNYNNHFMKIKGVSRDGGTKNYTNKSSVRKWYIATRCTLHLFNVTLFLYYEKAVGIYLVAISFSNTTLVCVLFCTTIPTYSLYFHEIVFIRVAIIFFHEFNSDTVRSGM